MVKKNHAFWPQAMRCLFVLLMVLGSTVMGMADNVRHVGNDGTVIIGTRIGALLEVVVKNGVGSLVRSGDPDSLKVEHVAGHLYITPVTQKPAQVVVVDTTGHSFRLAFSFDRPVDEKVVLDGKIQERQDHFGSNAVLSLIRSLVNGEMPEKATVDENPKVLFQDSRMTLVGVSFYETEALVGVVARLENRTKNPLPVPYEDVSLKGLCALTAQDDILAPQTSTLIYLVVTR